MTNSKLNLNFKERKSQVSRVTEILFFSFSRSFLLVFLPSRLSFKQPFRSIMWIQSTCFMVSSWHEVERGRKRERKEERKRIHTESTFTNTQTSLLFLKHNFLSPLSPTVTDSTLVNFLFLSVSHFSFPFLCTLFLFIWKRIFLPLSLPNCSMWHS